jgi:hypothetical protein
MELVLILQWVLIQCVALVLEQIQVWDQAPALEQVLAQVELALEPVELELAQVQVVAELELAQVEQEVVVSNSSDFFNIN